MLGKNSDFAPTRADGTNKGPREDPLYYWRFCDELSVHQAALLILGEDPSRDWGRENWPNGYSAVRTALINAVSGDRLRSKFPEPNRFGHTILDEATILLEDLRIWLRARGVTTGFFFPQSEGPDYLSPSHPFYAPKLAAAMAAWKAVSTDEELRRGKTVKQALDKWLRQHANEYALTKEDGNPNEQGIEDVAKIANWDTKGGAPKTPGS